MDSSQVLHLHIPDFTVAVERLHDRRLVRRPVVMGGYGGRSLVSDCSAEARRYGIRPGMRLGMAQRLCPEAVILLPDPSRYQEHHEAINDTLYQQVPVLEPLDAGAWFIDLNGMERFFGCERWTNELQHKLVKKTQLHTAAGRSINKLVSELASARTAPGMQKTVAQPEVPGFMAPVPVRSLPLIQPETARQLSLMGVPDMATLRMIDGALLKHVFGEKEGALLRQFALGQDNRKVQPPPAQRNLRESHSFDGDTLDIEWIRRILRTLAEKLAFRLRQKKDTCTCLHLRLEYADFGRAHRKLRFSHPNAHTRVIAQRTESLFKQIPLRRIVVRQVILEADLAGAGSLQPSLFPDRHERIDQAMDKLGRKG